MGIDIHGLNFLRYAAKKKALGRVATIGRQSLIVPSVQPGGGFCEEFLAKQFSARVVDSYDYSDYEGATHIVDMNRPLVTAEEYDTVVDCGTTEHIFNVSQALRNVSTLAARGAQIIHVLPANNFCGHGFWQFSPELFFSLYSEGNGFTETEVFLADLENNRAWFAVKQPTDGERALVISRSPCMFFAGLASCRMCPVRVFNSPTMSTHGAGLRESCRAGAKSLKEQSALSRGARWCTARSWPCMEKHGEACRYLEIRSASQTGIAICGS